MTNTHHAGRSAWSAGILALGTLSGLAHAQYGSVPAHPIPPRDDPSTTVVVPQVAPPYRYPRQRYDDTAYVHLPRPGVPEIVDCSSYDQRYLRCELRLLPHDQAWLVDQQSRAPCMEGRDWGRDGGAIWVANGCRGTFQIDRTY